MAKYIKYIVLFFIFITSFTPVWAKGEFAFERYYVNKLKGDKIGYSLLLQDEANLQGKKVILTHKHTEQKFKKYGLPIDVVQDFKFYEDMNGNPVFLEVYSKTGDDILEYDADFLLNKKVLLTYKTASGTKTKTISLSQNILFPHAISDLFKLNADEAVISYSTIEPENDFRVVNIKAIKEREQGKYNVYVDMLPNIKNEVCRDKKGFVVKDFSAVLNMEKISVPKKEIFSDVKDAFQKSRIEVDGKLDDVDNIKEITYKIFLDGYNTEDIPILNDNQRIIQVKDDIAYLKVKMDNFSNQRFKYPPRSKQLSEFLEPTKLLDFNNEAIKKFIKSKLIKRPKDSYKLAESLADYVRKKVKIQEDATVLKSASKSFSINEADKTNKAILLASLLRAVKIPAKVVVGVKYTNIPDSSFIYHPWVMAYVGKWVGFDANSENNKFGINYIALGEVDMASNDVDKAIFFDFLNQLNNMKIVILDFSLLHNRTSLEKDLKVSNHYSESGLLDYIRNSGMDLDEVGLKKTDDNDRAFNRLKNIEAKKFLRKANTHYVSGEITEAILDFEKVFDLTPVDDDYLNIDYAGRLSSMGLFHLAKERLSNISDHKIWSSKVEKLYKMYLPKSMPEYTDEKRLAKILSQITFAPEIVNFEESKTLLLDKKYKKSDYAHYILSKLYFSKGESAKAYSYIKKALKLNSSSFLYHTHKLNILTSKSKYRAALKEINWLLSRSDIISENSYALKLHKQYLIAKRQRNQDKKNFEMAKFYTLSNQNFKARSILQKLILNAKNKDEVYVLLGQACYNLKRQKEAKENFLLALTYDKKNLKALEGLGDLKCLEYRPDEALGYYASVLKKKKKSSDIVLKVANCHRDMINEKDALYYYFQALRFNPSNYQAIYNIAKIKGKYGDKSDMSDIYKQILSINPNYSPAWLGLVEIAIRNKNIFMARKYLKPVFYISKQNPEAYYYSGLIEVMNENYAYARRDFKKALNIDPYFLKAKFELDKLK